MDPHALIDTSLVPDQLVAFVRRAKDGSYSVADALFLHNHFNGMIPSVGDFLTTSYDDGFAFSVQIIARHRVEEPDTKRAYWCLVFEDVEDSEDISKLYACLQAKARQTQ